MEDIRTVYEKRKGYRMADASTIPCVIHPDGLLVQFRCSDAEQFMDQTYPQGRGDWDKVWYFNDSHDREIAEKSGDRIIANPQVLWRHFTKGD